MVPPIYIRTPESLATSKTSLLDQNHQLLHSKSLIPERNLLACSGKSNDSLPSGNTSCPAFATSTHAEDELPGLVPMARKRSDKLGLLSQLRNKMVPLCRYHYVLNFPLSLGLVLQLVTALHLSYSFCFCNTW